MAEVEEGQLTLEPHDEIPVHLRKKDMPLSEQQEEALVKEEPVTEAEEDEIIDDIAEDKGEDAEEGESPEDFLSILRPLQDRAEYTIGPDPRGEKRTYVQEPLSFFAKMEFYAVVGDALEQAMSGEDGLSLDAILGGIPGMAQGELSAAALSDADSIMMAIAKLAKYAPNLLIDCYCIWLNVPLNERPWFKQMVMRSGEGGLSDEQGIEILEVFVAQNAEAIESFFVKGLPKVVKVFRASRNARSRS